MKRVMALIAAILLLCTCALAEAPVRTGADLSYGRMIEMALYMRELVYGDYLNIKQVPENLQTLARTWAKGISDTPRLVVQLDINSLAAMVQTRAIFRQEHPMIGYEAESSVVVAAWQIMADAAAEEGGLNGASYAEIMRVNGQVSAFQMYAEEGVEDNSMFIVLYEDAAPLLMIGNGENGAVSIQGLFLPSAKLARCSDYGQVALWMMTNGLYMTCQEILPE